jgi:hypothetical protein
MEQRYLIDTNTAIDYLDNKLPNKSALLIDGITIQVSVITRIELLAWPNALPEQNHILQEFINNAIVYNIDEQIIIKAIEIRKLYKTKLPDAIIAATSLVHQLQLITRNVSDFKDIIGLNIINPHSI